MKRNVLISFIFLLFFAFISCDKDSDTTPSDSSSTTETDTTNNNTTDTTSNNNGSNTNPSTLTLNTFEFDGTVYTIKGDLTPSVMESLDRCGGSNGNEGLTATISIVSLIDNGAWPTASTTMPLKAFPSANGEAYVTITIDGVYWYAQSGTLNINVDGDNRITYYFSDVTFGDQQFAAPTVTKTASANCRLGKEYTGSYSLSTLGLNCIQGAAPSITYSEYIQYLGAGFASVNQNNESGNLTLYFKKVSELPAGTYNVVVKTTTDIATGNFAADEVAIQVLYYPNSSTSAYHIGQSGTVVVTKSDGDVNFEFSNIPTTNGTDADVVSGSFDCLDY